MSSKKLESILRNVPSATSRLAGDVTEISPPPPKMRGERIVAVVPYELKRQMKQYLVDHPGETEKTLLMRGLMGLGFQIDEQDLKDQRGRK